VAAWAAGHRYDGGYKMVNPLGEAGGYLVALRAYLDGVTLMTLSTSHEHPPEQLV